MDQWQAKVFMPLPHLFGSRVRVPFGTRGTSITHRATAFNINVKMHFGLLSAMHGMSIARIQGRHLIQCLCKACLHPKKLPSPQGAEGHLKWHA